MLCAGAAAQVTGVFARRGYNVQSLAVGNSEVEGQSRITMVIPGSADGTTKIVKQLNKLVHVQQARARTRLQGRRCLWTTCSLPGGRAKAGRGGSSSASMHAA